MILFFLLTISAVVSGNIYHDLATFCSNNGLKYITLTAYKSGQDSYLNQAHEALVKQDLRVRTRPYETLKLRQNTDTFVLLADLGIFKDESLFKFYLERFGTHRIRKSILIFTQPLNMEQENTLRDHMDNLLMKDAHFYMLYEKKATRSIISEHPE